MLVRNIGDKTPLVVGGVLIKPKSTVEIKDDVYKDYISSPAGKYYADKFLVEVKLEPVKQAKPTKKARVVKAKEEHIIDGR